MTHRWFQGLGLQKNKMLNAPNLASAVLMASLVACAPKGANLQGIVQRPLPPAPKPSPAPQYVDMMVPVAAKVADVKKVDVLFVIDTSDSMLVHQEKLKANLNNFAEAFTADSNADFHIGVVSIWDSSRYNKVVPEPYPLGQLRPLKDPSRPGESVPGPQYVKRSANFTSILAESLKIGVESRYKMTVNSKGKKVPARDAQGKMIDGGGPEIEELFSVVLPTIEKNKGDFYRPEAHLAVVLITDADDASPELSPESLKKDLVDLKGGNTSLVSGYAALVLKPNANCKVDPGRNMVDAQGKTTGVNAPTNILDFVTLTGGSYFDLCTEKFGEELGRIGKLIDDKVSAPMKISLEAGRPDLRTLQVSYYAPNGKVFEIREGQASGYLYDDVLNEISIQADRGVFLTHAGGRLRIRYVPKNIGF